MDLASEFKEIVGDLARFRQEMTALEPSIDNPAIRQVFQQIGQQWDEQSTRLKSTFPKALGEIEQQQGRINTMLDEARATAAEAEQVLAKGIDEEPSGLDMPMSSIDAPNGDILRDELLGQFGLPKKSAAASDLGSVADLASGNFASPEGTPPPRKPQPPPPPAKHPDAKPAPKKKDGDDAWGMTSGDWSKDD